jgi:FAD-dependent oxidoreductase domain-containing protein 1
LNIDGIAMGSYGYENEGWFDPWALLTGLKMKAQELGVHFVEGEVHNIAHEINDHKIWEDTIEDEIEDENLRLNTRPVREVHVHLPNGDVFPFNTSLLVIAAGAESGHIASLAEMGMGESHLHVPLPVEPRK